MTMSGRRNKGWYRPIGVRGRGRALWTGGGVGGIGGGGIDVVGMTRGGEGTAKETVAVTVREMRRARGEVTNDEGTGVVMRWKITNG